MTMYTGYTQCPVCGYRYPAQTTTVTTGTSTKDEYVRVVRCKDCKHTEYEDDGEIICTFWDFCDCNHHVLKNGFCDRAERKDE